MVRSVVQSSQRASLLFAFCRAHASVSGLSVAEFKVHLLDVQNNPLVGTFGNNQASSADPFKLLLGVLQKT